MFGVKTNQLSDNSSQQNVKFSDNESQFAYHVDSQPDATFGAADTGDTSLEHFFKRPIKIRSYEWSQSIGLFEDFNPWQDYFENLRVINRISNFNLLRCKLCVKILINGTPFHYGRAIASYTPLPNVDDLTRNRAFFLQDIIAASQRPHIYLDPTMSQGGELCLPFVWYNNALRIPQQDWRLMGSMNIREMNPLKHANDAQDPLTVSVFAWAEDVVLSIPTAGEPGSLSPQMGMLDEYKDAPISKPATLLAKVAGSLQSIPQIAPYARATEMAASTVASIAKMFGFSRPVELAPIVPYKPTLVGNMANTNVADTSVKMTLDCKQETTVDSRVMGLSGKDELAIKSIACRESYLTTFAWDVDSTTEQLLWNSYVNPMTWDSVGADNEIHLPACAFAALPFDAWRGTMNFRFQIVASSFHKGRLKITYDPYFQQSNEYNVCYTHIIDIANERDFTVSMGWGQGKSMLNVATPSGTSTLFDTTSALSPDTNNQHNGIISVYVVNELAVPNTTVNNDIEVNVYVSAGDDIEFYDPSSDTMRDVTWFTPQIGLLEPQIGEVDDHSPAESAPMKLESIDEMAATVNPTDMTDAVYYGDPITSFRQCLKRYNYHRFRAKPLIGYTLSNFRLNDFPDYRGFAPDAVDQPLAGNPFNYAKTTLVNYLTPAFVCRRGGMRWKYVREGDNEDSRGRLFQVNRIADSTGYLIAEEAVVPQNLGPAAVSAQMSRFMPHTWDGANSVTKMQNPVQEIELPWYTNIRFFPGKRSNNTAANFANFHTVTSIMTTADDGTALAGWHAYNSVAEDFNLAFYTGPPVMYLLDTTNEPAAS